MKKKIKDHVFEFFVFRIFGRIEIGDKFPLPVLLLRMILFPSLYITYLFETGRIKNLSYDFWTDTFVIYGVRYSGDFFRAFSEGGIPEGTMFRLVKRQADIIDKKRTVVTIERVK